MEVGCMTCERCGKRWVTPVDMKEFGVCDECRGVPGEPEAQFGSGNQASRSLSVTTVQERSEKENSHPTSLSSERSESSESLPSEAQKHEDTHVCATWQMPGCHDSDRGWCHHFILDEHVCDCGITTLPSAVPEQANGEMEQPDE